MRRARALTALLLALVLLFSVFTMTSCDRSYDRDEVIEAARELLPTARMLYSVYYGNGISYISSGYSDGDYREADFVHLDKLGFSTIHELKEISYSTFSYDYCQSIFSNYLESYEADNTVYNYARYVQVDNEASYILVYKDHNPVFEDRMTYHLDTVTDVRSVKDFVRMTVEVTVDDGEGNSRRTTLTFSLYEEDSGWRIASPCFANY